MSVPASARPPAIQKIIRVTAAWTGVPIERLASPARTTPVLHARRLAILVARRLHPTASLGVLARQFGLSGASAARWSLAGGEEVFGGASPATADLSLLRGVCRELGCWPLPAALTGRDLERALIVKRIAEHERQAERLRDQLAALGAGASA